MPDGAVTRGGVGFGQRHFPAIVAVHCALLVGCLAEPPLAHRPFIPALGLPMLALVLLMRPARLWCIKSLGPRWNTRILVIPRAALVRTGPYRYLRHPNYAARGDREPERMTNYSPSRPAIQASRPAEQERSATPDATSGCAACR